MQEENKFYILDKCFEYEVLKNSLTNEQLVEIDKVLKQYREFSEKYNNEELDIDTGEEYINKYGNENVIDWFEGLKRTEDFIKDFLLENSIKFNLEGSI